MATDLRKRPIALQVNNSGAWKTVARLDAGETATCDSALDAANTLGSCDESGRTTWRVITQDGLDDVLLRWCKSEGWKAVTR